MSDQWASAKKDLSPPCPWCDTGGQTPDGSWIGGPCDCPELKEENNEICDQSIPDRNGKWLLSDSEEDWSWSLDTYETRAEALAAVDAYCEESGEDSCFLGKAKSIDYADYLTPSIIEKMFTSMNEAAYCEHYGYDDDTFLLSDEDRDKLHAVVLEWAETHLARPQVFVVCKTTQVHATAPKLREANDE